MPPSEADGDLEEDEEREVRRLRDRACLVGAAGRPWISGRVEGGAKGGGAATDPSEDAESSDNSTGFAASCLHTLGQVTLFIPGRSTRAQDHSRVA